MANNTLKTRLIICSKTTAEWATDTTVVMKGEFAIELTGSTPKIKVGNGIDVFKDLPYLTFTPQEVQDLVDQIVSQTGHAHTNMTILNNITAAFTTELLEKLNGIEEGANRTVIDSDLSSTSKNPVENKAVKAALDSKVPDTRTVNGKSLSSDITLTPADVGADASGSATQALTDAKQYTDEEVGKAKGYTDQKVADLVNSAPETMDTLKELADAIEAHQDVTDALNSAIGNKVDKVNGKGLSTNDLTNELKAQYDTAYAHSQAAHAPVDAEKNIIVGVQKNGVDLTVDSNRKVNVIVPTKTSELTNDSGYLTSSGTVLKAEQLKTERKIDGVAFNGTADITHYGECSTAAGTLAKTVSITNFNLVTGARIAVKFTVTNTANNPTLNVGGTGAKAIKYRGSNVSAGTLSANRIYEFIYDGTNWELVGDLDTNTTYTAGSGLSLSGTQFKHKNAVTAGTAKGDENKTLGFGDTLNLPTVTYDSEGHITSKGTTAVTMPAKPTDISGNAGTADKLKTPVNVSITGAVTAAAQQWDGSSNLALAATNVNAVNLYLNQGDVLILDGNW